MGRVQVVSSFAKLITSRRDFGKYGLQGWKVNLKVKGCPENRGETGELPRNFPKLPRSFWGEVVSRLLGSVALAAEALESKGSDN